MPEFVIAEQMCRKSNAFPLDSSKESIYLGDKESKLCSSELVVSPKTYSDKSTSLHVCSASKWNGYVYKRRKLHRNSPAVLSEGNSTTCPNRIAGHNSQKSITDRRSQIESVLISTCSSICCFREHEELEQLFTGDFFKYTYECYLRVYGTPRQSTPNVGHASTSTEIAIGDSGKRSSSDYVTMEPLTTFASGKEHCIFVPKSHGSLGGDWLHLCSPSKYNGYVFKRRKLHRNSPAVLSQGNSTANLNGIAGHDSQRSITDHGSQIELFPNSTCSSISCFREHEEPDQLFTGDFFKYTYECYLRLYGTPSLSKPSVGHASTSTQIAVGDSGKCYSFDDVTMELLTTFTSVKEHCIFVLKSHGLLGRDWTNTSYGSLEVMDDNNKLSQSCKICGISENPIKMLICDLCEEAFHESCCKTKVKVLSFVEWHCRPCLKKKRKTLWKKHTRKSFENIKSRKRMWHVESNVSLMMKDVLPYASKVRIGEKFQAEIPDWSGPIYEYVLLTLQTLFYIVELQPNKSYL